MAAVRLDYLPRPTDNEPRIRGQVAGMQIAWRVSIGGWRCQCGKCDARHRCRHARAILRALPSPVYDQLEAEASRLGWSLT